MYVVALRKAVYVLHAFVKKPKPDIGLPKPEAEPIELRLNRRKLQTRSAGMKAIPHENSSDNIFTDLGFGPAAPVKLTVKSTLITTTSDTIRKRELTQQEAVQLCSTDQPTLSSDADLLVMRPFAPVSILTIDELHVKIG